VWQAFAVLLHLQLLRCFNHRRFCPTLWDVFLGVRPARPHKGLAGLYDATTPSAWGQVANLWHWARLPLRLGLAGFSYLHSECHWQKVTDAGAASNTPPRRAWHALCHDGVAAVNWVRLARPEENCALWH
jgi:hypothetical protein